MPRSRNSKKVSVVSTGAALPTEPATFTIGNDAVSADARAQQSLDKWQREGSK